VLAKSEALSYQEARAPRLRPRRGPGAPGQERRPEPRREIPALTRKLDLLASTAGTYLHLIRARQNLRC